MATDADDVNLCTCGAPVVINEYQRWRQNNIVTMVVVLAYQKVLVFQEKNINVTIHTYCGMVARCVLKRLESTCLPHYYPQFEREVRKRRTIGQGCVE